MHLYVICIQQVWKKLRKVWNKLHWSMSCSRHRIALRLSKPAHRRWTVRNVLMQRDVTKETGIFLAHFFPYEYCMDLCYESCLSIQLSGHQSCVVNTWCWTLHTNWLTPMDLYNELCLASQLSCVAKTLMFDITRKLFNQIFSYLSCL